MPDPTNDILHLLEAERTALRQGAFDEVIRLGLIKPALVQRIDDADPEQLARLRRVIARNQRLMAAAIDGVRLGATRIDGIQAAANGFQTYAPDGQRESISSTPARFNRRS